MAGPKKEGKFTKKFGKSIAGGNNSRDSQAAEDLDALKKDPGAIAPKKKKRSCAELFLGKLSRFFVLLWICILIIFIILLFFKVDTELQLPKYKELLDSVSNVSIDSYGVTLSAYNLADPSSLTQTAPPITTESVTNFKAGVSSVSQGLRDVITLRNELTPTVAEERLHQANTTAYVELFVGHNKLRAGLLRSVIAWGEVAERLPVKLDSRTSVLGLKVTPVAPEDFWFVQNALVLALQDDYIGLERELYDSVGSWWRGRKTSRVWVMVVGLLCLIGVCVAVEMTTRSRLEFLRECTFVLRMLPNDIVDSHKLIERFMSKTRHA